MFALTIDQRGSRRADDAVPELIADLAGLDLVRAFERTAGDEVQGLVARGETVVDVVLAAVARGNWWIGVGVGAVQRPLPPSVRASRGPALLAARQAVERAHRSTAGVAVDPGEGVDRAAVRDAETALQVLARLVADRSPEGVQAVEAMAEQATQASAAEQLGISPQAMSRRLQVARWGDEKRLRELAARLLDRADEASGAEPAS